MFHRQPKIDNTIEIKEEQLFRFGNGDEIQDYDHLTMNEVVINWFESEKDTKFSAVKCEIQDSFPSAKAPEVNSNATESASPSQHKNTSSDNHSPQRKHKVSQKNFPHPDKLYGCKFCDSKFKQKLHLYGHLLNKHRDISNIESYVKNKVHYCQYCQYRTINNYNLARHMECKHGVEVSDKVPLLKCNSCKYTSRNKGNLTLHVRRHNKMKQLKCAYCEKCFCQKVNLHTHMWRTHSEKLNNQLEHPRSPSFDATVSRENTSHSDKPYECDFCGSTFRQKLHLDGHLLSKHCDTPDIDNYVKSKIHYCQQCQYRTINNFNLARHVDSKHGPGSSKVSLLKCKFCTYAPSNNDDLQLHLKMHSRFKGSNLKACQRK